MESIRLAESADAPAIRAIYAPLVRDTVVSFETEPPDEAEMRDRIETTLETHPWLVCERDGTVAGYAYAGQHRKRAAYGWCADVSVYVHRNHREGGIGRSLYESLFALLRAQGFYNAYAGIALPNPASIGLHESMGFERVGVYEDVGYKAGAWHDVGWWATELREHDPDPAPPLTVADLDDVVVADALDRGTSFVEE